ncbi:MAG TPA: BatA domain-containing protein [Pirellulales bacterium]|nr:BatA domain-containing protein [Pirellulales bacterium]
MITFASGAAAFAIAGLVAALAPVIVHLLQHHRYQTIDWAAMDFLCEALQQSRRTRLRDILLLILRMACVALFGLAMARPFLTTGSQEPVGNQPVHAVLLIDNSLSMAYEQLGSTLLDQARSQAHDYVESLPLGSRVSVLPLCASEGTFSRDAYLRADDALDALDAVTVADRESNLSAAAEMALEACRHLPEPRGKRVVLFSDVQANNWPAEVVSRAFASLDSVQVVPVGPRRRENAWIADLRSTDAVAAVQAPTEFVATVRYEGVSPRRNVEVTFAVDDVTVDSRTIDLQPGQTREITVEHRFTTPVEPGGIAFATVRASLSADRLAEDDSRTLMVPLVEALPVLFVDQWGSDEDPALDRYGETYRLRRLMQSSTSSDAQRRSMPRPHHLRIGELSRDLLAQARLVVVAGIESPGDSVTLLREFIESGGQIIIAAGDRFDPRAWNQLAWRDAAGILPAPLSDTLFGSRPIDTAAKIEPFALDPASMQHPYFLLEGASPQQISDLYREPLFFQAVAVASSTATNVDPPPRVIARFDNGMPFIVERTIGRGRSTFIASAIQSDWNTLTMTNAVLMFDRMIRGAIEATLPRRNFESLEALELPVDAFDRQHRFSLLRPVTGGSFSGIAEPLTVDAIGTDDSGAPTYGVRLADLSRRGVYRVIVERAVAAQPEKLAEIALAINGPGRESELASLDEAQWRQRVAASNVGWVGDGTSVPLDGPGFYAPNLWKWLLAAVLAGLVFESVVLALPNLRREQAA